jgi:hypothetical protein
MCLILATAISVAAAKPSRLSVRAKRAACAVAFYHIFYRNNIHRFEVQQARKRRQRPTRIFLEAYDESHREVTPAALITALRREGLNVHRAWTGSKWRRSHDPKCRVDVDIINLSRFKYLDDGRIQWRVQDLHVVGSSSEYEHSLLASTIELKRQKGLWRVVKWHVEFAAGSTHRPFFINRRPVPFV